MPKRSNLFQQVVFFVHQHMAGEHAEATESAVPCDLLTGTQREVDITVESEVVGHRVMVSLECRDWTRPQTVSWVEEMHAKHQKLPTNLLILVSSSGFTPKARQLADKYGIELLQPGELTDATAARVGDRMRSLWLKKLSLSPRKVRMEVEEADDLPKETVVVVRDQLIYSGDGEELTSMFRASG